MKGKSCYIVTNNDDDAADDDDADDDAADDDEKKFGIFVSSCWTSSTSLSISILRNELLGPIL